jgi:hypothetical protein
MLFITPPCRFSTLKLTTTFQKNGGLKKSIIFFFPFFFQNKREGIFSISEESNPALSRKGLKGTVFFGGS